MSISQQLSCSFHGIGIDVLGPQAAVSSLASRLGQLTAEANDGEKLHFEFFTAPSPSMHRIDRPRGQGRAFYQPLTGDATYYPDSDELYLDYGGRARALCRPAEGHCFISLQEPESDQLWLGTHPLFTIPLIEMLKRRGKFNVHAAAFALGGCCVLLPGTTGAGKSTLTVCLLRGGLDFLGDDMAFVERRDGLRVLAFPESIDITDTTASFFQELHALTYRPKRPGWPKHEIRCGDYFSSRLAWNAQPKAIVFPQIGKAFESKLTPITSDEAFLELAPNVLLTEAESTRAQFEVLAQLVKSTPLYRLRTGRDFDRIPQLVGETLQ
ncbi:MAG: hypothetical protein ABSC76_14030 [Terracidiphilus sp.]|jgi:hypothetical protein